MDDKNRPILINVFSPSGLVVAAILIFISALLLIPGLALDTRDIIILLGVAFAITGWLFTSAVNIHNRIKQHTFELIIKTRFDDSYKHSASLINLCCAGAPQISEVDASRIFCAKDGEDKKIRDAIGDVLNYYEVIAISIWYRDANEEILKEYYKDVVTGNVKKVFNFFQLWRVKDKEAFIYIEWLYNNWVKD